MSQTATAEVAETKLAHKDAWYPPKQRDAYVVRQLVTKDFKLKYRRSFLGIAWSVLNPLLMMTVQAIVFTTLMRRHDASVMPFPVYLILGNTAWHLMSDGTSSGMHSIINAQSLLKKVRINRLVFPLQKVLFALVNYVFSLAAVVIVVAFFAIRGEMPNLNGWVLAMPIGVLFLAIFSVGLSLFLSSLAVFFRDVLHLWSVVLIAWMYLTPLFYSIKILPAWLQKAELANPMNLYITFIRRCVMEGRFPGWGILGGCVAFAFLSVAIGYAVFRKTEDRFILFI